MPESPTAFLIQFDQAEPANEINSQGLLTRMTHEMAEPLGAIESIAYYLRMVLPKDDLRTQQHLARIEEIVEAMHGTLGDALQYLRQTPPDPQVIDLRDLLSEATNERTHGSRPEFVLEMPDEPVLVRVDPGQGRHLLRSFFNLFRGFANRCECVTIRVNVQEPQVMLEFMAPGFKPTREEIAGMLSPFTSGFAEGSGLALASARRIVESNGGRLSARSDDGRDLSLRGAFPLAG